MDQSRSPARTVALILGGLVALVLLCCGGSALFVRLATPNVWKLMTMSADDFAAPDAGE
jgi:hypothetical protein